MSGNNELKLSKCSLRELEEILQRQDSLIKNRNLIKHLNDKGSSILKAREKVIMEIERRAKLETLESSFANINLSKPHPETDKHVEYVFSKDKCAKENKFKPYSSSAHLSKILHSPKDTKSNSSTMSPKHKPEITAASEPEFMHQPAIVIPLSESLKIQRQQMQRVTEKKQTDLLELLFEDEITDSEENSM